MKQLILSITFIILWTTIVYSQNKIELLKKIALTATDFNTDVNANAYILLKDNSVIEYSNKGDSVAKFNEVRRGKISKIDVTNPLSPLLFVKNFGTIIHLDNVLSQKNAWMLGKKGYNNISLIAASTEGNIWMYNDARTELIKLDALLRFSLVSPLLQQIPNPINPYDMVQSNQYIYLLDSTQGVLKFDMYGTYITTYDIKSNQVQVLDNNIIYLKNNTLYSFNTTNFQERKIDLPEVGEIKKVQYQKNSLYILTPYSFYIYTYSD